MEMGSLSVFRPPQFSEDDAWLPAWLQHCNFDQLNVEAIKTNQITFEQRVEEWQFHHTGLSGGELSREEGGCNIGQLFISGPDTSPLSFVQSAATDGVQFHLFLSSDGDSENRNQITDAYPTKSKCFVIGKPLKDSGILGQGCVKLNSSPESENCSRPMELERHLEKPDFLKHDENMSCDEGAPYVVELCIAASEALVINEIIESDTFAKSSSASAILEASLQIKQTRLEVWRDTLNGSSYIAGETCDLSDLDDIAMESAYEDAGLHLNELHLKQLSVSQVKDTFDSEYDGNLKLEKTTVATANFFNSSSRGCIHMLERTIYDDVLLKEDVATKCLDDDMQNRVIDDSVCGLGNGCCSRTNDHVELRMSVSAEPRAKVTTHGSNVHETNVSSSPNLILHEKENTPSNTFTIQEQFNSRWFGGWINKNEMKYTTVKHNIPQPFGGETSFLSESADVAPDENSYVQNHDKGAMITSQLSVPTETFHTTAIDGMVRSQDVGSSNTSLVDPLCSVVPCSVSENICSSPEVDHEDNVQPGNFNVTTECNKTNVFWNSPINNLLGHVTEKLDMTIANIEESRNGVSRKITSLRDYSKLVPKHTKFPKKHGHWKNSLLMESNIGSTSLENCEETVRVGVAVSNKENKQDTFKVGAEVSNKKFTHTYSNLVNGRSQSPFQASVSSADEESHPQKGDSQCAYREKPQKVLSQCKTLAQKLPMSKRVHFCERETMIPDKKKLRILQTEPKTYSSTRAFKESSRLRAYLESGTQLVDQYVKNHLNKEKKRLILQNMEFLLTGFSHKKEMEIEGLIRRYGGIVLSELPSINLKGKKKSIFLSQGLPIVLCLKKTQSFKFLYGCAVNAYVLKVDWLHDSLAAGSVLPPKKYMILPRNISSSPDQVYKAVNYDYGSLLFKNLGVMLHGKTKYFSNIATIIKHGGGQIFKTLHRLIQGLEAGVISMGIIVAHDESCSSRHLKQCALEQNIPIKSVQWIMKSLYAGQLIPLGEKNESRGVPAFKRERRQNLMDLSQEI